MAFVSLTTPPALGEEPSVIEDDGASDNANETESAQAPDSGQRIDGAHETDSTQERARLHFASGLEHVRNEKYQEALQEFLAAQELAPHPAVLFNIARAYEELYQLEQAAEYYSTYLATAGDVSPRRYAQVEKALGRLRNALPQHKGSQPPVSAPSRSVAVSVICPYPDFQVTTNEVVLATTPLDGVLLVPEDAVKLSFVRPGYQQDSHRIPPSGDAPTIACNPVRDGALSRQDSGFLNLGVQPSSATVFINGEGLDFNEPVLLPRGRHLVQIRAKDHLEHHLTIDVDGSLVESQVQLVPIAAQSDPVKDSTLPKVVGATLAGVGALLAGTTIGLFAWNDGRHNDWRRERDDLREEPSSSSGLSERQADSNARLHSIQALDTVTWTTGIAAGTFIAAGAFTYFFNWTRQSEVALAPARISFTSRW